MNYGFISRNLNKGLIYDGDLNKIDSFISQSDCVEFNKLNGDLVFSEVKIKAFGKILSQHLPICPTLLEDTVITNITTDFYDYITKQASTKNISDTILGIREHIFKQFKVLQFSTGQIVFQSYAEQPEVEQDVDASQGDIVKRKEFLDGYTMINDYKMSINGKTQELPLKHDYSFVSSDQTYDIKNNYTVGLRRAMFGEISTAYNRSLLQKRQRDVIKRMGQRTVFTAVRRSGKSFLLSFLAIREMMKSSSSLKNNFRPTTVLFLGLSEKGLQPVLHYMRKMIQTLGPVGEDMFHYDSKFNILSFREQSKEKKGSLGYNILGQIIFLSCEARSPGVGHFADCIIVDEGAKVPRDVRDGIEPIITHEGAKLITCSTTYKGSKKGWFYELLTDYEKHNHEIFPLDSIDSKILSRTPESYESYNIGIRYTIDEAELIPDKEKEAIKIQYSKDSEKYLSELYGRFPDEGKVFKYESYIQEHSEIVQKVFKYITIATDPALTGDVSATMAIGYNEFTNKFAILDEQELTKTGKYEDQVIQLKSYKKSLQGQYKQSSFFSVFDGTQKGIPELFEINGYPIDLKIAYNDGSAIVKSKQISNEYKVPKHILVETTQMLFDNERVMISNNCKRLMGEMDNFFEIGETGGKFQGVGSTDDFVNAMMIGLFMFYEHLALKYTVIKAQPLPKDYKGPTQKDVIDKVSLKNNNKIIEEARQESQRYFSKYVY